MSYFFALPPIDDLTVNQQAVLNEPKYIKITGAPGTGKSVVALWRFLQKLGLNNTVLLLTYTKTLEAYFKGASKNINSNAPQHINRTLWWSSNIATGQYNEIIVDEAQDVEISKYEIIKTHTKGITYGFDPKQSLYFNEKQVEILENELEVLLPNNIPFELSKNYRNTYEILRFVRSFLTDYPISQNMLNDLYERNRGEKPQLVISDNEIDEIVKIINTFYGANHNIGILVPFCTPNTLTAESNVEKYLALLKEKIKYPISHYCTNLASNLDIENIHLTTFKSAKGLEFDTVIIPKFHDFNFLISNTKVVEKNDFYVALTRAKNNLFLLSKEKLDFLNYDTINMINSSLEEDLPF
jgi:superfamily I DNA/RNA helicase